MNHYFYLRALEASAAKSSLVGGLVAPVDLVYLDALLCVAFANSEQVSSCPHSTVSFGASVQCKHRLTYRYINSIAFTQGRKLAGG